MLLRVLLTWLKLRLVITLQEWFLNGSPSVGYDQVAVSSVVPDHPNVWTDGSLVLDKVAGISSPAAGFYADHAASFWNVRCWGQVDLIHPVGNNQSCRGFCSVPGPLQYVTKG